MVVQRDMDLARAILLELEKLPFNGTLHQISIDGYTVEEINYHVLLLSEAGLLVMHDASHFGGMHYLPTRLTWAGHEFIDTMHSDSLWQRAKAHALKTTGVVSLGTLTAAISFIIKELIEGRMKL
jgi:hypothetical protein